ncbi:2Fe-2S iron-sulfur cluster binding domain-containing protein [Bordetella petrii]|nr:2Fe-2S iron-sulfur cluster binding domain-containing protein [Bordetella petrii]
MPKIIFTDAEASSTEVEAASGESVMLAALGAHVKGILGECGGSLACATCHVYVDDAWTDKLPSVSDLENEMLDATVCERRPNSRLCCQIEMSEALDGLTVRLPAAQI